MADSPDFSNCCLEQAEHLLVDGSVVGLVMGEDEELRLFVVKCDNYSRGKCAFSVLVSIDCPPVPQ